MFVQAVNARLSPRTVRGRGAAPGIRFRSTSRSTLPRLPATRRVDVLGRLELIATMSLFEPLPRKPFKLLMLEAMDFRFRRKALGGKR
jgi:hypothetical protein